INYVYLLREGMEAVGVVTAVGPGLTGRQVGDIVAYAGTPMGAYAEEQILPADKVVPVPSSVDPCVAASVMLKGMTAQFLLRLWKSRTFTLGDKLHSFFAPEGKPPRRGLNPRPLACDNNLPKVTLGLSSLSSFEFVLVLVRKGFNSSFDDDDDS
nr:groES-like zinc-binding alcohol dehydrogenase family protein [Tanacetum cinerariifolium]